MNSERTNCILCNASILLVTAEKTNGRCMPCFKNRPSKRIISGIFTTAFFIVAIPFVFLWELLLLVRYPWNKEDNIYSYLKALYTMPKPEECLIKKIEIDTVNQFLVGEYDPIDDIYVKQFRQKKVDQFLSKYKDKDELWFFRYPDKYWEQSMGRQGYVIMRDGKRINYMVTCLN